MSEDNRVPKIIREFANDPAAQKVLSFLSFEDWLNKKENEAKDWLVVARSWRSDKTDLFTFSALASSHEESLKQILSTNFWEVDLNIGHPAFNLHGEKGFVYYSSENHIDVNGFKFKPFTIHREFHGYIPNTFELVQDFILYHGAFFVPESDEYHCITMDGEIHPVVRIIYENENQLMMVDTHHLRDYLAARQCFLVRYHDHRRFAVEDIGPFIKGKFVSHQRADAKSIFELWLRTDLPFDKYQSSSRLLGKDLVLPYAEPDQRHISFTLNDKYVAFVIARDDQGNEVEATCNEDELSNYFTDRGTPHFLTPVFFTREVLGKYYQEPRRYDIGGSLNCLHLWQIPIDITKEGLVHVWLGDLGRIPYKEQLHWRQFNVPPRGTITKHRWLRDFMAEFADPELEEDPIYYFNRAFKGLQKEAKDKFGMGFFKELSEEDRHAYKTLHLPISEEWKEFDELVQSLAKTIVDSLNVELLSQETEQEIDGSSIKGSIDLLGAFLCKKGVEEKQREKILTAFQAIQAIRSTGVAHRKGSNFEKALTRFQLAGLSNLEKFRKLVMDAVSALSLILENLHQN